MRNRFLFSSLLIFALFSTSSAIHSTYLLNRIEGTVYNSEHRPLENVYVELKNDMNSPAGQTRTNSSGRFTFTGMPGGRYLVKAMPLGTNFMEQTQEVFVTNLRRNTSDVAYIDFYLQYNKRSDESANAQKPEVIFVQDIPPAAKKLFEDGKKDLKNQPDKGFVKIEEALKIFPQYFDALSLLGKEYILRREYEKAYPYLLKAIDVNSRSFITFYRLGYSFYQIKEYPASLKASQAAIVLAPDSADANLLYGTVLRITGNLPEAEKSLLEANSLFKEKDAETHWQLALLYNKLNRNQAAVNELETYLKLKPDAPDKVKIQELIAKLKNSKAGK